MTQELATIEQTALSPAEFVQELEDARLKAKALTDIVEEQNLFTLISGKKHLRVEAWQTIGMGYGLSVAVTATEILHDHLGVEYGAKATVVVYNRHGTVVGGAEAYCMCDEGDWGNRNTNQRISMAGTRATSKALRLLLSWVVVLAGYEPTPAEEITHDTKSNNTPQEDLGTCEQHGVAWFKSGKMRVKAHKLDDGSWCNAPTEPRQSSEKAPESAPVAAETAPSEELNRAVTDAFGALGWEDFEKNVLPTGGWANWIQHKGTSESALARLNTYLEEHPAEDGRPF